VPPLAAMPMSAAVTAVPKRLDDPVQAIEIAGAGNRI
jgi:hypothetical protein